ncbi:sulfate adenylyltransferase subunit 1 [Algoriella xinjiangensis]|uniref:sulfate adenylyltransferase n=1 Tax=Algoriella xinjiangensis TaxID=684065 RepID=A0A1I4VZ87_9FLAO|nr:GTP-binding protein [Algoriella xinjiangensis]SFN06480.1 sulfate adenylyltransferase subunit 1 [Algoriella xinjiangensis]VDH15792.1 Bifunctional enzyme CysN/CysC [Algoriella xinjiangensis]
MDTLKFITAGNVDDGKSTLIGRLLYDSHSIHTDQLGVLQKQSKNISKNSDIDLALVTDGLRAEREQGITIDVAYKYFATDKRKFIIADAPGHEQYTRNMVTGVSNSDLIIILIDARHGVTTQTKRHASIGSLIGLKKAIVAINKMDLEDYSEKIFTQIKNDFEALLLQLNYDEVHYVPISALVGDNIVSLSENTPWYKGQSILSLLETITIASQANLPARFQVQYVIRPQEETLHDYRGYAGLVLSGKYKVGDDITILPANIPTKIVRLERDLTDVNEVIAGENVVIHLADNIDISRGDSFILANDEVLQNNKFTSWICWLDQQNLQLGKPYILQHRFKSTRVKIKAITQRWDVNNWEFIAADQIGLNDIAQIEIQSNQPLVYDVFTDNNQTGNAILIDETTHNTVGALMIL